MTSEERQEIRQTIKDSVKPLCNSVGKLEKSLIGHVSSSNNYREQQAINTTEIDNLKESHKSMKQKAWAVVILIAGRLAMFIGWGK